MFIDTLLVYRSYSYIGAIRQELLVCISINIDRRTYIRYTRPTYIYATRDK